MDEKTINKICFIIIFLGLFFFIITFEQEYQEKTISEMTKEIGTKGIVIGKVDFVLREEPLIFILQNEEKIKVFYPKKMFLEKGDVVRVFAQTSEYNREIELFAQKVEKK